MNVALDLSKPIRQKSKTNGTQNQFDKKKEQKKKNKKAKGNENKQKKVEQWKEKVSKDGNPNLVQQYAKMYLITVTTI